MQVNQKSDDDVDDKDDDDDDIGIFAAKTWAAFAMQKLLTFLQQKISMHLPYFKVEILTWC